MLKYIRKAALAAAGAFVTGELGAIVNAGGWPGWPATGAVFGAALIVGRGVWRIENARQPAPVKLAGKA